MDCEQTLACAVRNQSAFWHAVWRRAMVLSVDRPPDAGGCCFGWPGAPVDTPVGTLPAAAGYAPAFPAFSGMQPVTCCMVSMDCTWLEVEVVPVQ